LQKASTTADGGTNTWDISRQKPGETNSVVKVLQPESGVQGPVCQGKD